MSPPREIELKLDIPAYSLPLLTASSPLKGASKPVAKPVNLVSVYFDTDKLKLRQKGLSLRVRELVVITCRQSSRKTMEMWPCSLAANGNTMSVRKQPDLEAARGTALAPLLNKRLRRALKPVFETHVNRKVFQIQTGESEIELSIDKGKIEAGAEILPAL